MRVKHNHQLTSKTAIADAQRQIITLLNDQKQHLITELRQLPLPYEQLDAALHHLIEEEFIYLDGLNIVLNHQ